MIISVRSQVYWKVLWPAGCHMFKVNNRSARTRREICSKLTIKTPERRQTLKKSFTCNSLSILMHSVTSGTCFSLNSKFNIKEGDVVIIYRELKTSRGKTFFHFTKFVNQMVIYKTFVLVILISAFAR